MRSSIRRIAAAATAATAAAVTLGACGATRVTVAPVQVQPIHMTIDVNLHDGTPPAQK